MSFIGFVATFMAGIVGLYFLSVMIAKPNWAIKRFSENGIDISSNQFKWMTVGCFVFFGIGLFFLFPASSKNTQQTQSTQTVITKEQKTEATIDRLTTIAMADDIGKSFEGKHPTKISANDAHKVAQQTSAFLSNSANLIDQGARAQTSDLSRTAQTAFTILGTWPKADEMLTYNACEMALRNLARISSLRQASLMTNDAEHSKKLSSVAESLVANYKDSSLICSQRTQ